MFFKCKFHLKMNHEKIILCSVLSIKKLSYFFIEKANYI